MEEGDQSYEGLILYLRVAAEAGWAVHSGEDVRRSGFSDILRSGGA